MKNSRKGENARVDAREKQVEQVFSLETVIISSFLPFAPSFPVFHILTSRDLLLCYFSLFFPLSLSINSHTDFSIWLLCLRIFLRFCLQNKKRKKRKQIENETETLKMLHLFLCKGWTLFFQCAKRSTGHTERGRKSMQLELYCWCLQLCWLFAVNRRCRWSEKNVLIFHNSTIFTVLSFWNLQKKRMKRRERYEMDVKKREETARGIKTCRHSIATQIFPSFSKYLCCAPLTILK